jgi:hypothetical protein
MTALILIHVAISLVGILTGFFVMFGMLDSKLPKRLTAVFLWTTFATSVTGFFFPFRGFTPALGFGILSVVVLAFTFRALYHQKLAGSARMVFLFGAILAQYLNFFVLIVQSFLKIPALNVLAPTQKEPPFAIAQGAALLFFVAFTVLARKKFRPALVPA